MANIQAIWDVAILIPGTEQAPIVAREMFLLGKAFALLIPVDLVPFVAEGCPEVEPSLQAAKKVVFLNQHLLWLISDFGVTKHEVFNVELVLAETGAKQVTRAGIAEEQKREGIDSTSSLVHVEVRPQLTLDRGLWGIKEDDLHRVLVPSSLVQALVWSTHLRFNHARAPRLNRMLRPRFLFLTADGKDGTENIVKSILEQCHFCAVASSKTGYSWAFILHAVDLSWSVLMF